MVDMSKYGTKHTCFGCAGKFYDLNRAVAICPKCGADQANAPKVTPQKVKAAAAAAAAAAAPPPLEDEPDFVEPEDAEDVGGLEPDEFPTLEDTEDFDDDLSEDVSASFGD
jgi:uncharacterized protein (TIGR02300 family)